MTAECASFFAAPCESRVLFYLGNYQGVQQVQTLSGKPGQIYSNNGRISFIGHLHIIAKKIEINNNNRVRWCRSVTLQRIGGRDSRTVIGFPINLITAITHRYYKYFIVLKDLGLSKFSHVTIDYKGTMGNEYLMHCALSSHVYYYECYGPCNN